MPKYEELTIIDQIEIVRPRVLQVRFGIVMLEDGQETATLYHRGTIAPGDDPAEFLARQARGMDEYGYPPHHASFDGFLHELATPVHTQDVIDLWKERESIAMSIDGAGQKRPLRHDLQAAGGRLKLAAPDESGYQRDSIVDQIVINRARTARVEFGLVVFKGEREVFRRFNRASIKPGIDPSDLVTQARAGLRQRGDPVLTTRAEELIGAVPRAVHTPSRTQRYAELRDAQLLEILTKHQESGRSGEPRVPPEISKEAALRVALEG